MSAAKIAARNTARFRAILGAIFLGGSAGAGYLLYEQVQARKRENSLVVPRDFNKNSQAVIDALFAELGDRRREALQRMKSLSLTLLQYDTCPFCGKVKAFMDIHGIPYSAIEVDPFSKAELADIPYKKVPVLRVGTSPTVTYLVDSAEIVGALAPLVGSQITPEIGEWRLWNTEVFMRYVVLSINLSIGDAMENYRYIQSRDKLSWKLKMKYLTAGVAMFLAAHVTVKKNLVKRLGRPLGDVRQEMNDEFLKFLTKGLAGRPFHGGSTPDVADTDIYGILLPLKGHRVYRDLSRLPLASEWIQRMEAAVEEGRKRQKAAAAGAATVAP